MTKVLLIEDERLLAEVQRDALTNSGYEVVITNNALDAIEAVDIFKPDFIVADVLLAGATIFALLHELQSYGDTKNIPVILCTNIADQFNQVSLKKYGVYNIIDKSTMLPDDIRAAIKACEIQLKEGER